MARRKNTKRFDPRYFMDEKTDIIEEGFTTTGPDPGDALSTDDLLIIIISLSSYKIFKGILFALILASTGSGKKSIILSLSFIFFEGLLITILFNLT